MKQKLLHSIVVLGLFLTAGCAIRQQTENSTAAPVTPSQNTVLSSPTNKVTPTDSTNQSTVESPYQIVSPAAIRKNNRLFEVSARLTKSNFQIIIDVTLPPEDELSCETSPLPDIFTKFDFTFPAESLVFEPYGGGGGCAPVNGMSVISQERDYKVTTPITKGQKIPVTVLVTFGEFTGLTDPIPFNFDLIVE